LNAGKAETTLTQIKRAFHARDADAKVTVLTVVIPFHVFSADADQLVGTRADYERRARMHAAEILTDAQLKARARAVYDATCCSSRRVAARRDHQDS
jgi:hypothetical protein